MTIPISFQRLMLQYKAVMIQCLDKQSNPIQDTYASGFLLNEGNELYLYTSWHVVTGYDMDNLPISKKDVTRMSLRISILGSNGIEKNNDKPGVIQLKGLNTLDIPLYENGDISLPLWYQETSGEYNGEEIIVPPHLDLIKLRLPSAFNIYKEQAISSADKYQTVPSPGERIYIVGYPYHFSALGGDNPLPIVLTRFIASNAVENRPIDILIDGVGAPGMSGAPVFIESENKIFLLGIYKGEVYTKDKNSKYKEIGALGVCVRMFRTGYWYKEELIQPRCKT